MATITKATLAQFLADNLDLPKARALEATDVLFQSMTDAIVEGDRIEIRGFGSWEVKATKAKPHARNPSTGEGVYVPARRKVMFKPGKILKDVLSRPAGAVPEHPAPVAP